MNIYLTPSFYAHVFNGLFLFAALIIFIMHFKTFTSLKPYELIKLLLLLSLVAGIHSISHLGLESVYNYNPLSNLVNY
jgi:hypothetical protein